MQSIRIPFTTSWNNDSSGFSWRYIFCWQPKSQCHEQRNSFFENFKVPWSIKGRNTTWVVSSYRFWTVALQAFLILLICFLWGFRNQWIHLSHLHDLLRIQKSMNTSITFTWFIEHSEINEYIYHICMIYCLKVVLFIDIAGILFNLKLSKNISIHVNK